MKIAVEGCCHGELDAIYSHINQLETKNSYKVDLLLICGDFQAVRNHQDLQCMAVPDKYKELRHFYKYYTEEKKAPILTIVIGGNHEASNYMWELYHGGWLAPNIYFLGHAGCVQVNGVRIAGASGIFKSHDFQKGSYERIPYDSSMIRSIYHIREYCVRKLSLLSSSRIFLSHDWPQSIEHYGDINALLSRKRFLRADIDSGSLGSPPLMGLLTTLKPEWWFSAHLHTRYEATVLHGEKEGVAAEPTPGLNPDEITIDDDNFGDELNTKQEVTDVVETSVSQNPDEITLEDEVEDVVIPPPPLPPSSSTKFLALDKCLPRRQFLEVIDIETENTLSNNSDGGLPILSFDPEWLAISRAFHPWLSTARVQRTFPEEAEAREMVTRELEWVMQNVPRKVGEQLLVSECQIFAQTAPGPGSEGSAKNQQPPWYTNPQTEAFCSMLELKNKINPPPPGSQSLPTNLVER
ncbi:DBR1-domain-containing protein [Collybia nuda]|uniref:DBR1-domain-containing protein n=1 Tax=Collybia nuda TaxID=64659 RepID=A0A9P6CEX5_9AGAR|nr:DBR1-domain-containing protein [Collybia nuda]